MCQLAAIDDETCEALKDDACDSEGLKSMGCASVRDAWEEFRIYDLPDLTTRSVTLCHIWASAQ
eukprot:2281718-Rhodomonas_salina.1